MKWRVVMLRKVAILVISAGLMMSPMAVQALGFGGIKLNSSLNEKLDADVALLSATSNDVQSLTIKLATEEAFLRAGIDRTALLNKLRFKVKKRSNGDYYIHVTTTETVREPFMNFLLELNWKNGRMLREYTMLIDPPGRAPKQIAAPAPVVAETVEPEPEAEPVVEEPVVEVAEESTPFVEPVVEMEAEPAPEEPVVEENVAVDEPLEEFNPEPVVVEEEQPVAEMEVEPVVDVVAPESGIEEPEPVVEIPAEIEPVAESEPAVEEVFEEDSDQLWPSIPLAAYDTSDEAIEEEPAVTEDVVADSDGEMGDLDYGIIKKGDNLWNIAEKLRQGDESVSVHQVMMALLKNNPDAFIDNNVHRLKVGHVLRIDDPSTLTSMSRKEAANAFIEQTDAWNNYRQQVAQDAGVQPIMAGESATEEQSGAGEASGELTLAAPDGESLTAGGGANEETLSNDLATMQDQLRQAKSDAGTMRTRNVELNNKLQSLEDELNRLQRSLSVKDDELAALQQQLSSLNQKPVEVAPTVTEQPSEQAVVEEKPEPVAEQPAAAEEVAKPEVAEPVVEQAKPEKSPVEIAEREQANPEPATEQGIMDTVMGVVASLMAVVTGLNLGSDTLLFIGAPILLVFLIILVIVMKRRRQGDNFQESILTGAATASAADAGGVPSGDSTTFSEESSFLSDFAMSGASAIEADDSEVDPLTEADVFMAYGRYEAAEERLNEAIQSEPNRMELRAKLIELYHATQNKAAFESSAEDFYASLGGNEAENPLWAKVVDMGAEIAPGNPLFSQGGGTSAGGLDDIPATSEVPAIDDPGMGMTDSQVMDIGLETGVFAAADLSGSEESSGDDMDFNLDLGDMGETAAESDMDFNLDIGGGDEPAAAEEPAADLDFNLDMGTTESTEPVADIAAEPATEDAGLDFNLDMGTADVAAEEPVADLDLNMDLGTTDDAAGLDFDLDIGGDSTADAGLDFDTGSDDGALDLNLDASDTADADIGGGDEVGTKLDLAKAYIDMGDPEGARSILDEVMDEGSSTQKEEAQSLLGQIA